MVITAAPAAGGVGRTRFGRKTYTHTLIPVAMKELLGLKAREAPYNLSVNFRSDDGRSPPGFRRRRLWGRAGLWAAAISAVNEFMRDQRGRRFVRWSRRLAALEQSPTAGKSDAALEAEIEEAGRLAELIRATPGKSRAAMLAKVQVMIRLDVAGEAWAPFLAQVERSFSRRRARTTMAARRKAAWR